MYHIAICDDDEAFIQYLKRILLAARGERKRELKIYEYRSGETLVFHADGRIPFDVLILDMQLGGMDGDETAKVFRTRFPDSVLVFCSGVRPPTIKSFLATPFRYLMKSQSEKEFVHVMSEVLDEVERRLEEPSAIGHYRHASVKVKLKNILYMENAKRGSRIIVRPDCKEAEFEDKILIDRKIDELAEEFKEFGFAVPHNSYLVNMNHIEVMNSNDFLLDNGEIISISRAYQKTFKEAFAKYVANKY